MVNENEVLTEQHIRNAFTPENFGLMLQRIDNFGEFLEEAMEKGMKEGIVNSGQSDPPVPILSDPLIPEV